MIRHSCFLIDNEYRTPLLERVGRTVRLTPSGQEFIPHVQAILDSAKQSRESVEGIRNTTAGHVRIGATGIGGNIGLGTSFGVHTTWATGQGWSDAMDLFDDISTTNSTGFLGGAYLTYEFNKHIALQVEALAAENGWSAEGTDSGDDYLTSFDFFGIEAPVMAKGMLPLWRGSLFALAGPVFFFPLFNLASHEERNGVETEFPEVSDTRSASKNGAWDSTYDTSGRSRACWINSITKRHT